MNINQYDSYFIIILFLISLILYVARSTKGIKRLSRSQRAFIFIPNDIKETLIGILLGDGHIVRRSLTGNSRLVYAQSASIHKEYFYHVIIFLVLYVLMIMYLNIKLLKITELKKHIQF